MKKTIILWSLYIFSLVLVNVLQAYGGNPWDPRDERSDQEVVGEQNEPQPEEME